MRHKMHENFIAEMLDKKFNRWTVLRHESREKGYWCRCDCGTEKAVRTDSLKKGTSKSCGCLEKEEGRPSARKENNYSAKKEIYKRYKSAAKRRKHKFNLTFEEFENLIESRCKYCGTVGSMTSSLKAHKEYKYNGVDRVDNIKGYTKQNSVSCCKICNTSKACLTLKDWSNWIEQVHQYINNVGF